MADNQYMNCAECKIIKKEKDICCVIGRQCCFDCMDECCPILEEYDIGGDECVNE